MLRDGGGLRLGGGDERYLTAFAATHVRRVDDSRRGNWIDGSGGILRQFGLFAIVAVVDSQSR